MNERSRNVAVGLTVTLGIVGLIVMTLLFGYVPQWLQPSYGVQVRLPHADGLAPGSPVQLHGIRVGQVEEVRLAEPAAGGVIAEAHIRDHIRLPETVEASVARPIFGGSTSLELSVPDPVVDGPNAEAVAYLPTDGSAQITGRRTGMFADVSDRLAQMLDEPVRDIERVADRFESLSDEWTDVGRNVNRLLEPRDPAQVDRGEAASNLHSLVQRTDTRLAEMREVIAGLRRYTDDDELHENIREAAASARELGERLPEQVDELSGNVNEGIRALRSRYIALADDLSGTLMIMQQVVERAEEGEGTLGRLLADPSLYDNLNDTVERMQHTVDDLRLLIQKWEAEGVPIQF